MTLGDWKDVFQIAAWAVAIAGGLIAAFKAIHELRLSREQRARDLAWNQAREAYNLIDRMSADASVHTASQMLDYSIREYELPSGTTERISIGEVCRALRTKNLSFSGKETFVRDVFDSFIGYLERVHSAMQVGLVRKEDVVPPLEYYARIMARHKAVFDAYMRAYRYDRALALLAIVPAWASADMERPYGSEPEVEGKKGPAQDAAAVGDQPQ